MHKDLYDRYSAPPHPGEILREDILPQLKMTRREFAAQLGVSRRRLSELLLERRTITAELAARLDRALGLGVHYWLGLQFQYDLWWAQRLSFDDVRAVGGARRLRRSEAFGRSETGQPYLNDLPRV
ncbi:MAG: HigA family addiction module antitoxin [Pseudomonadota bacterium]